MDGKKIGALISLCHRCHRLVHFDSGTKLSTSDTEKKLVALLEVTEP